MRRVNKKDLKEWGQNFGTPAGDGKKSRIGGGSRSSVRKIRLKDDFNFKNEGKKTIVQSEGVS